MHVAFVKRTPVRSTGDSEAFERIKLARTLPVWTEKDRRCEVQGIWALQMPGRALGCESPAAAGRPPLVEAELRGDTEVPDLTQGLQRPLPPVSSPPRPPASNRSL